MNNRLNKTAWGELDEPEMHLTTIFDEIEKEKAYDEYVSLKKQSRKGGQGQQPTWLGVGVMTLVGMVVGFVLGVGL